MDRTWQLQHQSRQLPGATQQHLWVPLLLVALACPVPPHQQQAAPTSIRPSILQHTLATCPVPPHAVAPLSVLFHFQDLLQQRDLFVPTQLLNRI